MTRILRTAAEMDTCPVGTEAVDKDDDVARRVVGGWTYRPRHVEVLSGPGVIPSGVMLQYGPLVTINDPQPEGLAKLDGAALHQEVWEYMEKYPHSGTGPYHSAKEILAMIKKAVTQ